MQNNYNLYWVPTSYFDGGQFVEPGTSTSIFTSNLNSCGARSVPDLEASLTAKWKGNAKVEISLAIENNDNNDYTGTLRVYIIELESTLWNDYNGNPYYHAFLDHPWNQALDIDSGDTFEDTKIWDGAQAGYPNVEPDNLQVILAVFDDTSHQAWSDPYHEGDDPEWAPFLAYYVDETVAAYIQENQPPNQPIITGPTDGEIGIEYEYTIEISDPDDDNLNVWIDWGDETQGWLGPYPSGEVLHLMHQWSEPGVFEVKVKTRDTEYQESEWSEPLIVSIGNLPPNKPEIDGPSSGKINTQIEFTFTATDPNNDDLLYYIDWGDGNIEEWIGPHGSGEEFKLTHSWDQDKSFGVKAKVKDTDGEETLYTTHVIKIPRIKTVNSFLSRLFQQYPVIRFLLQLIYE